MVFVTLKKLENVEETDEWVLTTQQEFPNDNSVHVIFLKHKIKYDVQKQLKMVC